jgi:hypothetical protein
MNEGVMFRVLWWLTGERRILTTTLSQYRQVGRVIELAGQCYRITRVYGDEVWGRLVARSTEREKAVVVESPLKQLRQRVEAVGEAATLA